MNIFPFHYKRETELKKLEKPIPLLMRLQNLFMRVFYESRSEKFVILTIDLRNETWKRDSSDRWWKYGWVLESNRPIQHESSQMEKWLTFSNHNRRWIFGGGQSNTFQVIFNRVRSNFYLSRIIWLRIGNKIFGVDQRLDVLSPELETPSQNGFHKSYKCDLDYKEGMYNYYCKKRSL